MGILFIILYILIKTVQFKVKNMNKKTILIIFIIIFVSMYALIYTSQFISYEDYERLINVRYNVPNEGAVSAINNWIDDRGSLSLYMVSIINAIRMMFPIELLLNGPFYMPFVVYQRIYFILLSKNYGKFK